VTTDSFDFMGSPGRLLLTVREAASALAISERTLWTLTKTGAIRSVRLGRAVRYALTDLQDFIAHLQDSQRART
jgi:excisionase family DNA binding protein